MPALRTDDGPRKLRAVWLGPKGAALPFEWTYVQWAFTLVAVPLGALVAVVVFAVVGAPPWILVLAALAGAPSGLYASVRIMKTVSYDEPLRHKRDVLRTEFARGRRAPAEALVLVWPAIKVVELIRADLPTTEPPTPTWPLYPSQHPATTDLTPERTLR